MSRIVAGALLLAVEPASILTRAVLTLVYSRMRRVAIISSRKTRYIVRQLRGKRDLLLLPDELLTEVLKLLEWQDILRLRSTCLHLNTVSKSRSIWQTIVKSEPPEHLWLECPLENYGSGQLEYLFIRRKRAEAGYKMVAEGATPHIQRWALAVACDPRQIYRLL
ncbi:hypothetical protein BDN72DRAFT_407114 [Pluteus cervinus]|uniref:Uncharacterized protein n=1 Tax=Pluteus cervinus TaxID=181527 RepID=A0ACD3A888_9AGAR|nr:hypothetical protein BDN72DRAFT_407114 [Pluteus cervinus]